ncbi:Rv3654c family TadE-like protein [Bifidobacterium gallicum]|uniref:Membrane spanning protein n=1 Tax=Bifidobacterium gallicum DSM 20093 = LMG 11596 TaxID=561180 RepID=D1NVX3_9BIFI|nr:Rv3654c family TadE-like protein [Bifidobacterium gallicum]EFA22259.1 TadE-like protein [Bifidobacterium gallicum DSM 20093 = LMG 11596]KFI59994.1 membrane spanning protein [Bifidobacterium gallicum DSM 20093 = LMG 11596]
MRTQRSVARKRALWLNGSDEGSMTVVGAALVMLCALLIIAVLLGADVLLNRAKAQSAADMAALAGAQAYRNGNADACALAQRTVLGNDATFVSCRVDGDDVRVEAARDVMLPVLGQVNARSRAGPVPCGA